MSDQFVTVSEAFAGELARTEYLVWTDMLTRRAYTVLSVRQVQGGYILTLRNGNEEVVHPDEELTVMPRVKP